MIYDICVTSFFMEKRVSPKRFLCTIHADERQAYRETLKKKFSRMPEIARIKRHRCKCMMIH